MSVSFENSGTFFWGFGWVMNDVSDELELQKCLCALYRRFGGFSVTCQLWQLFM